jgi:hypothetical protein
MVFDTTYGADIEVNLAAKSEWVGGFSAYPGAIINIRGAGVWDNDTTTSTRSTTNIVVSIAGKGTIVAGQRALRRPVRQRRDPDPIIVPRRGRHRFRTGPARRRARHQRLVQERPVVHLQR